MSRRYACSWRCCSRDARVTRRELPSFLVRTTLQPILFTTVFGFLLPHDGHGAGLYTSSLLPGILAISLSLASLQAVALPMVTDFGFTGEIEDRLLAPCRSSSWRTRRWWPASPRACSLRCSCCRSRGSSWVRCRGSPLVHLGSVLAVAVLGAAAFSGLGLVLGTAIPPQQIGLMFSAIIAPMMFFGCAYYPWSGLDRVPAMKYAVLLNPLVYVSEGLRGTLTPDMPHMRLVYSLPALAVIGAALWALGIHLRAARDEVAERGRRKSGGRRAIASRVTGGLLGFAGDARPARVGRLADSHLRDPPHNSSRQWTTSFPRALTIGRGSRASQRLGAGPMGSHRPTHRRPPRSRAHLFTTPGPRNLDWNSGQGQTPSSAERASWRSRATSS